MKYVKDEDDSCEHYVTKNFRYLMDGFLNLVAGYFGGGFSLT